MLWVTGAREVVDSMAHHITTAVAETENDSAGEEKGMCDWMIRLCTIGDQDQWVG
jgi:hypothetical protein